MKHDDVYELIAKTAITLKKVVPNLSNNPNCPIYPKNPIPILEIVKSLKEANDCSSTIKVMKSFVRMYG
jgi:hypothetical protein